MYLSQGLSETILGSKNINERKRVIKGVFAVYFIHVFNLKAVWLCLKLSKIDLAISYLFPLYRTLGTTQE